METQKTIFNELLEQIGVQTDAFIELMDPIMQNEEAEITQKELRYIATGVLKAMVYSEKILHILIEHGKI